MRTRTRWLALLSLLVLAPAASASADGVVAVTSVQAVGGGVTIRGTASLPGLAGLLRKPSLVASAGSSGFVQTGKTFSLIGTAFGGTAPYTFKWSTPVGKLDAADATTATLDTTNVAAGTYTVSLAVTDAAGKRANDTVKVTVYPLKAAKLLDKTVDDPQPGVTGTGALVIPFNVPPQTDHFDVKVTWDNSLNDYDLTIIGPDGSETTGSGGSAGEPETGVSPDKPVAGEWKLSLDRFATVGDTVHAEVNGEVVPDDPRPSVSGGPFRFLVGATQNLSAAVTGGAKPLRIGWDTDEDGVSDLDGATVTARLTEGRHLVTIRVTDANGLERILTTSVMVATASRLKLETAAVTVIGLADTGVNPYHMEFSADTYPDPDVLALTKNFTRHPSEYIPGYPADAKSIPITHGQGYLPPQDKPLWDGNKYITAGKLYWIPGTKVIGAVSTGPADGTDAQVGAHPILDDNGHGDGSASVAAGNRYGYCPSCLIVMVEGLNVGIKESYPWVDISSNSFGPVYGLPTSFLGAVFSDAGPDVASKTAVERGQTVLFAAGNGVGNAFDVPQADWGESYTGMPWNISVGALRRDNQRAVVGDGIPVHISAWGDGDLPSACRTGIGGQCAFGGTSAATPYTAGVFGSVLTAIRRALGDVQAGQKANQVIAQGVAIPGSPYLSDGKLTRAELREVVLKTAEPLNQGNNLPDPYLHPVFAPYVPFVNVLFEGYGAASPNGAARAIDVLLGKAQLPDRSFEDSFFEIDNIVKTSLYGSYDSDGDGQENSVARPSVRFTRADVSTVPGELKVLRDVLASMAPRSKAAAPVRAAGTADQLTYYLHRLYRERFEPPSDETPGLQPPSIPPGLSVGIPNTTTVECDEENTEEFMDQTDSSGDLDPCFNSRVTSVVANFRPLAIWTSTKPLEAPLPAGSTVDVELYMAGENPALVRPTGVLVATDREIGIGAGIPGIGLVLGTGINGALCDAFGDACWTKFAWSFETTRPAFTGEQLAFQVQLLGARSWAFGYEGNHTSKITITPGAMPATGLGFDVTIAPGSGAGAGQKAIVGGTVTFPDLTAGATEWGDHPVDHSVQVSVDDPTFANPIRAEIDDAKHTWTLALGTRTAPGLHTIYVRAAMDRHYTRVVTSTLDIVADAIVQCQAVAPGALPNPAAWKTASGFSNWTCSLAAKGDKTLFVRVLSAGSEIARTATRVLGSKSLPATGVGDPAGWVLVAAAIAAVAWMRRRRYPEPERS